MSAKAVAELFIGAVPRGGIDLRGFDFITEGHPAPGSVSGGPDWGGEIIILVITACYVAVILALTARRAGVAPATLAISARAGLVLGLVMYAVDPLGGGKTATSPWLRGSATGTLEALAWVLLFGAPAAAGALTGRRCYVPEDPGKTSAARAWQSFTAGLGVRSEFESQCWRSRPSRTDNCPLTGEPENFIVVPSAVRATIHLNRSPPASDRG